jgi:hypothetical protein
MLINCEHEQVRALTPQVVNQQTGLHLHRFNWLTDDAIGSLPVTWNYLEGWHSAEDCPDPTAVHFTRGGPWFEEWQGVEYGGEWRALVTQSALSVDLRGPDLSLPHIARRHSSRMELAG